MLYRKNTLNCVINLAPDKGQVLSDALRVLKPGGRLAVSDIVIDGNLDDIPLSEIQIRSGLNWAGCIAGALTRDQYQTLLEQAGFSNIDVDIRHRYSPEEMLSDIPGELQQLDPALLDDLIGRFTSCAISAVKP